MVVRLDILSAPVVLKTPPKVAIPKPKSNWAIFTEPDACRLAFASLVKACKVPVLSKISGLELSPIAPLISKNIFLPFNCGEALELTVRLPPGKLLDRLMLPAPVFSAPYTRIVSRLATALKLPFPALKSTLPPNIIRLLPDPTVESVIPTSNNETGFSPEKVATLWLLEPKSTFN